MCDKNMLMRLCSMTCFRDGDDKRVDDSFRFRRIYIAIFGTILCNCQHIDGIIKIILLSFLYGVFN